MELFDKPVEYWADEEDGRPVYKFQVSDTGYQFMYDILMSDNCIDVSFCALDKNNECEYDIMNSGNSVLVFSTVVSILKKLLDDLHPRMLIFSAKEPRRQKLYLRMVKSLLPTWETNVFNDGLGMGLSISRSIIEAHGGRLDVKNNPDRGATFYFTIPVYKKDS